MCRDPQSGNPNAGCLESASARKAFARAFRIEVTQDAQRALEASLRERAIMEYRQEAVVMNAESNEKGLTQ